MKLLSLSLRGGPEPIYRQVAGALRTAIEKGVLRAGEALPSARALADDLSVNRHTIRIAYEELIAEGWVRAEERLGYFVTEGFPVQNERPTSPVHTDQPGILFELLQQSGMEFEKGGRATSIENLAEFSYNLESSMPDLRLFPSGELRSCFSRALRHLPVHMDYQGVQGEPLLHAVLSDHMRQQRQLIAHKLILTHGSQEALFMAASLLLGPGSAVAVEEKGYQPAWQCFRHFGAELVPIRLDGEGICPHDLAEKMQRRRLNLLYLTPLHQYPTTVGLTPARRARVLALLREHRVPLLEDDYDHDVHFDSFPPLPMAAQDKDQLVIYVSTLSKLIFPGARLGFLALPRAATPWFLQMKAYTSRVNETLASRAVALWIQDGGFERHLRRIRRIYQDRRDHLLDRLKTRSFFQDHVRYTAPKGGMNLWLDIGMHPADLVRRARSKGLLLSGEHLYVPAERYQEARHLRVSFASHTEKEMDQALGILQVCMREGKKSG